MTMKDVKLTLGSKKLFLPIGTIEQHGPHLPLSVDVDIPASIASFLAKQLDGIVAPPIYYGARSLPQSGGGPSFPGTIAVRAEPLIGYYRDVIQSFISNGANELIIINGHYENEPFIFEALDQCRENGTLNAKVIAFSWWSFVSDDLIVECFGDLFPGWHAEHAGIVETSMMMYLHPERVNDCLVNHNMPPRAGIYIHPADPKALSTQGVLARTEGSSAEIGKLLTEHICQNITHFMHNPHGMKKLANALVI